MVIIVTLISKIKIVILKCNNIKNNEEKNIDKKIFEKSKKDKKLE